LQAFQHVIALTHTDFRLVDWDHFRALKAFFFLDADVRPLLDFQQHSVFQHAETMSARDHHHYVARGHLQRLDQSLLGVENIDFTASLAHH